MKRFIALVLLCGCSKEPEAVVKEPPSPSPALGFFSTSEPGKALPADTPTPQERATPAASEVPTFKNPATQQAFDDYLSRKQTLHAMTPPAVGDISGNPAAIQGYLNNLGANLNEMKAAEDRLKQSMSPEELKQFKRFQKGLETEQ